MTSDELLSDLELHKPRGWHRVQRCHVDKLARMIEPRPSENSPLLLISEPELAVGSPDAADDDATVQQWVREIRSAEPVGSFMMLVIGWFAQQALQAALCWLVKWAWRKYGK